MTWEPPYKSKSDEWLLDSITEARGVGDDHSVGLYIKELQERGVYPLTVGGTPVERTVERMVEFYGAYWHIWGEPLNCPHCKADLRDHEHGPPLKREIAWYDRDKDRTTKLICPDCKVDLAAGPTLLEHILETS